MSTPGEMNDFNQQIIEEFRANDGVIGGPFEGSPVLILHSTGAKSGLERINPVMYRQEGDVVAIFASKAGAPDNPDWYHNVKANPDATIEIGTETRSVHARITEGAERDGIWERHKSEWPQFAEYEAGTSRTIPVVVLEED